VSSISLFGCLDPLARSCFESGQRPSESQHTQPGLGLRRRPTWPCTGQPWCSSETGIDLMEFGFVVARFGVLLRNLEAAQGRIAGGSVGVFGRTGYAAAGATPADTISKLETFDPSQCWWLKKMLSVAVRRFHTLVGVLGKFLRKASRQLRNRNLAVQNFLSSDI